MTRLLKGRQAVYLVKVPTDWKPQSLWSVPPSFSDGVLHGKNLRMQNALGFCRTHNKAAIQAQQQQGQPIKRWAIVSKCIRPSWRNHPLRAAVETVKGGAV